ncbi:MAG: hypothetical protein ACRCT2_15610, partial [Plesiomonas shigelloides]
NEGNNKTEILAAEAVIDKMEYSTKYPGGCRAFADKYSLMVTDLRTMDPEGLYSGQFSDRARIERLVQKFVVDEAMFNWTYDLSMKHSKGITLTEFVSLIGEYYETKMIPQHKSHQVRGLAGETESNNNHDNDSELNMVTGYLAKLTDTDITDLITNNLIPDDVFRMVRKLSPAAIETFLRDRTAFLKQHAPNRYNRATKAINERASGGDRNNVGKQNPTETTTIRTGKQYTKDATKTIPHTLQQKGEDTVRAMVTEFIDNDPDLRSEYEDAINIALVTTVIQYPNLAILDTGATRSILGDTWLLNTEGPPRYGYVTEFNGLRHARPLTSGSTVMTDSQGNRVLLFMSEVYYTTGTSHSLLSVHQLQRAGASVTLRDVDATTIPTVAFSPGTTIHGITSGAFQGIATARPTAMDLHTLPRIYLTDTTVSEPPGNPQGDMMYFQVAEHITTETEEEISTDVTNTDYLSCYGFNSRSTEQEMWRNSI